jgi:hypothetical protein
MRGALAGRLIEALGQGDADLSQDPTSFTFIDN